jgi:IclR family KDG regulon transcriptional repressor
VPSGQKEAQAPGGATPVVDKAAVGRVEEGDPVLASCAGVEKTVVKALQVLEALAHSDQPRGVSELARELKLSKSNVYRLLETLRESSYVDRVNGGTSFELTLKLWQLGSRVTARLDIKARALPYLRELRDATRETARLTVLHGDRGICIEQIETEHPLRVQTPIGGALLLYCSATGKAMLAFQSKELIAHVASSMQKFTPATARSRKELLAELERIRRDGFAINRGERIEGVCGVAAPVTDSRGAVRAAIGVSGPAERLSLRSLRSYGPVVRDVARRLSHDLGAPVK